MSKSAKRCRVSQRITSDLAEQIDQAAANLGVRKSILVRMALETYLNGLQVKALAAYETARA